MRHANKLGGAIALVAAVVAFQLLMARVISTDDYATAAQAQAHGELAFININFGDSDAEPSQQSPAPNLVTQ